MLVLVVGGRFKSHDCHSTFILWAEPCLLCIARLCPSGYPRSKGLGSVGWTGLVIETPGPFWVVLACAGIDTRCAGSSPGSGSGCVCDLTRHGMPRLQSGFDRTFMQPCTSPQACRQLVSQIRTQRRSGRASCRERVSPYV